MSCILVIAMKLAHPMQSVIPSAHGAVLAVLARTAEPLSGRQIATLTRPRFSQSRVNSVLGELARDGIVQVDVRPPASYYRLNRDHVAASGVLALASMWQTLLDRIRASVTEWSTQPIAAWIFGSAARAEATATVTSTSWWYARTSCRTAILGRSSWTTLPMMSTDGPATRASHS